MDIFVRKSRENYYKIVDAFKEFGMPTFDMTEDNFLNNSSFNVFSFGNSPVSIDILTHTKELDFDEAFNNSTIHQVDKLSVRIIDMNDLIQQKKVVNRPEDINDIERLRSLEEE